VLCTGRGGTCSGKNKELKQAGQEQAKRRFFLFCDLSNPLLQGTEQIERFASNQIHCSLEQSLSALLFCTCSRSADDDRA
jgi:hypothetical protein